MKLWAKSVDAETANTEVNYKCKNFSHRNAYLLKLNNLTNYLEYNISMSAQHLNEMKMYAELTQKICCRCKESKNLSEFTNNSYNKKDGKDHYCRPCKSIVKKETYQKDHEKIKKQVHESYRRNKDKCILRAKNYRIKNRDKVNAQKRFSVLGVTAEQYKTMLTKQESKCAICGIHSDKLKVQLSVDHNHNTGQIRELLCNRCNTALGLLRENLDLFKKSITYLKKHQK
jgi:hypothetical protein